jgi:hypothetical protein
MKAMTVPPLEGALAREIARWAQHLVNSPLTPLASGPFVSRWRDFYSNLKAAYSLGRPDAVIFSEAMNSHPRKIARWPAHGARCAIRWATSIARPALNRRRPACEASAIRGAWKLLGKALSEAGQPDEALAAYEQGIVVAEGRGDLQAAGR